MNYLEFYNLIYGRYVVPKKKEMETDKSLKRAGIGDGNGFYKIYINDS